MKTIGVADREKQERRFAVCQRESDKASRSGWILLLISGDELLYQNLTAAANARRHFVVKIGRMQGGLAVFQGIKPTALLLDLDLPQNEARQWGELLFQQWTCPPLVLLTAETDQADVRTTMQAGLLVDKTKGPSGIFDAVKETLLLPETKRTQRSAIQRVLLRWLKPSSWTGETARAFRGWGIND